MPRPVDLLRHIVAAPGEAARDLASIADAVRVLPDMQRDIGTLATAVDAVGSVPGVGRLADSLPGLIDAVRRVPAIHTLVADVAQTVQTALAEVILVRETVVTQRGQVEQMQATIAAVDQRTRQLTQYIADLHALAQEASRALPDPDAPGPLTRAREAISGVIEDVGDN